jgi:hypothetical protein
MSFSILHEWSQLCAEMHDATATNLTPSDTLLFSLAVHSMIQNLSRWSAQLHALQQSLRQIRQSFGYHCPTAVLSFLLSFLSFEEQRSVARSSRLWYIGVSYNHRRIYWNENPPSQQFPLRHS